MEQTHNTVSSQRPESTHSQVYTIHSQKGGVGKTSVAIAIAGFAWILHRKKALIVDADLTGTSLADLPNWSRKAPCRYFNDLILAKPPAFARYTSIPSVSSRSKSRSQMAEFYHEVPDHGGIHYMPASPVLDDVLRIVPLISQENLLHFFRDRLEDIIRTAVGDDFGVIIIDHPPGLFGLSTASLDIVLKTEKNRAGVLADSIDGHALLLTSPDPADYRALVPSLWRILEKHEVRDLGSLNIDVILNEARHGSRERFDPPLAYRGLLKNIGEFPDKRVVDPKLIKYLKDRAKRIGALACQHVLDFSMAKILDTVQSLQSSGGKEYAGMKGWCRQLAKGLNLWKDDN